MTNTVTDEDIAGLRNCVGELIAFAEISKSYKTKSLCYCKEKR